MAGSLLLENPWLRDEVKRKSALHRSAASSSAVEGIVKPFTQPAKHIRPAAPRKSATSAGSRD